MLFLIGRTVIFFYVMYLYSAKILTMISEYFNEKFQIYLDEVHLNHTNYLDNLK